MKQGVADLGEVDLSKPYTATFPVRNTGTEPLRIELARKSCKCAQFAIEPPEIPPGKEGTITLTWKPTPGQAGTTLIAADLTTNDPAQANIRVEARGRSNPVIHVWPEEWAEIDFALIPPNGKADREIKVYSTKLEKFDLEAVSSHPGVKVTTLPLAAGEEVGKDKIRSGYRVALQTTPQLPTGYLRETLTLKVKGDESKEIVLPLYAQRETGALQVVPAELHFKQPRLSEGDSQKFQVRFLIPGENEKVEVARLEPAFLQADAPQKIRNGLWQVTVRIPPKQPEAVKFQPDGFFEGKIVLKTSAAEAPELPVRLKWHPRPEK